MQAIIIFLFQRLGCVQATPTNIEDPNIAKATAIHPAVDEESVVADGNGGVALPGGGGGAIEDGTLPLETGPLPNLQVTQVIQIPAYHPYSHSYTHSRD